MSQRRSRRIAGQEPSLVDDETAKVIITELIRRGYSEERAYEIAYEDDPEWKELFFLYMDLKTKGFEEELALDLVNTGKASYIRRLYDSYLPLFHNDGQASAKFASLFLEMSNDQLELNDVPLFLAFQCAQRLIMDRTIELEQYEVSSETGRLNVGIAAYEDHLPNILLPHEVLLTAWEKLATAMSSITNRGCITLCIQNMELSKEVFDMLLESVQQASPLRLINLVRNNLFENDYGIEVVVDIPSIEYMGITSNLIESADVAHSLTDALINHPKLEAIILDSCGLGCNDYVMKSLYL